MQLDGTLEKFPLRELIEMVVYSSVTGVLELRAGDDIGQIFFRDGQPYHAVAGELAGADAVAAMFEERDAPFRFVADQESHDTTLWIDPWELIERAEDQSRKWAGVRARITSMDCVPALLGAPQSGQIHISDMIWPVLSGVDGQRTITEIAEYLNLVLLDTCLALITLADQGLIVINPPRPVRLKSLMATPSAPTNTPADADKPERSSGGGFLERLLAEAQANEQRPSLTDEAAQERKRVYRYVDDRR